MINELKNAILLFLTLTIMVIVVVFIANYFGVKETPVCQDLYKYINNGTGIKLFPNIEQKMIDTYTESNYSWFPYRVNYEKGKMLFQTNLAITCEVPVRYCDFKSSDYGKTNQTVRLCIDEMYIVLVNKIEQQVWKYGN